METIDFSSFLSFSPFVLLFCIGIVGEMMLYKNTRRKEEADAFLQEHETLTSGVLEDRHRGLEHTAIRWGQLQPRWSLRGRHLCGQ